MDAARRDYTWAGANEVRSEHRHKRRGPRLTTLLSACQRQKWRSRVVVIEVRVNESAFCCAQLVRKGHETRGWRTRDALGGVVDQELLLREWSEV